MHDDPSQPPRLTVGQALVIGIILVIGFFAIRNGQALIVLVVAMGFAAWILNRLFALILRWTNSNTPEHPEHDEE